MATETKHHDPRKLRPAELCRLLNSTPAGEVISERQLLRHRNRAGLRIGDGSTLDLLRYTAWLVQERHKPRPVSEIDPYARQEEIPASHLRSQTYYPQTTHRTELTMGHNPTTRTSH